MIHKHHREIGVELTRPENSRGIGTDRTAFFNLLGRGKKESSAAVSAVDDKRQKQREFDAKLTAVNSALHTSKFSKLNFAELTEKLYEVLNLYVTHTSEKLNPAQLSEIKGLAVITAKGMAKLESIEKVLSVLPSDRLSIWLMLLASDIKPIRVGHVFKVDKPGRLELLENYVDAMGNMGGTPFTFAISLEQVVKDLVQNIRYGCSPQAVVVFSLEQEDETSAQKVVMSIRGTRESGGHDYSEAEPYKSLGKTLFKAYEALEKIFGREKALSFIQELTKPEHAEPGPQTRFYGNYHQGPGNGSDG